MYFPIDGVASILALADGVPVEVGTIGNEGLVGLPVFLGAATSAGRAMVQVAHIEMLAPVGGVLGE